MKLLTKKQTEECVPYMTTYDAQEYCIQKVADFRSQLLDAECVRGMILRGEIVLPPEWEEMSKEKKQENFLYGFF